MKNVSTRFKLIRIARLSTVGIFAVSTSANGFAIAQNSSLFQRPVSTTSFRTAQNANQETLPSPGFDNSRGASNTNPNMGAAGSMAPQGVPYNTPLNGPSSLMGLQSSWTYIPPSQTRTIKLHDIVSIRVDEASTSLALGNATSRKSTSYDAVLRDWVRLVGIDTVKPAPQADGDPRVQAIQNEVYRGDSTLRTNESMTTNIAAEVVDIRPNGLIVLSGTKKIIQNDNTFLFSLTGTCRSQDILPDNTVLSRNLINATINKQDQGHVRDGYSRGWLTLFLARIKPF